MTREVWDGLLFALSSLVLVLLLTLLAAPDLVGRGVEWVLS